MTTWRRGGHNPYTVYQTTDRDDLSPEYDAELNCIGFFRTPEDAEKAVAAVNILATVGDDDALRQLAIRYDALIEAAGELARNVQSNSSDALLEDYANNLLSLVPGNVGMDSERSQAIDRVRAFVHYLDSDRGGKQSVVWAPNEGVTLRLSDLRTLLAIVPD